MNVFWQTIAGYNAATWPLQALLVVAGIVLTALLYRRPSPRVKVAMKVYLALLNGWIAVAYYLWACAERPYSGVMALFWGVMAAVWIYDIAVNYTTFERTRKHDRIAFVFYLMPFVYPLFSLLRGLEFPMVTSPVMPCSVAVFTIGLMLAFSEQVNIVLAMFLCHWALIGLSKVYFFGIPEDYLLACSTVPALYIFFREYVRSNADRPTKPSAHVLDALLIALSLVVGIFFTVTLLHQLDLFTQII